MYHDTAPYASQANVCSATYLVSGEAIGRQKSSDADEDVDMDGGDNMFEAVEGGGDKVPQFKITLVNEKDLDSQYLTSYTLVDLTS